MGIDVWEVIDAAKTKPFGFQAFYPGPGLGGHCIPIDPFYLTWAARAYGLHTRFIELAGEINTAMPHHVVDRVMAALNDRGKPLKGSRVLVLGAAYKPNVDDCRESPAFELMELLQDRGAVVSYNDPHVPVLPPLRGHTIRLESMPLTPETLAAQDCVLIATDHALYDWDFIVRHSDLVVDTRGATRGIARAGRERSSRLDGRDSSVSGGGRPSRSASWPQRAGRGGAGIRRARLPGIVAAEERWEGQRSSVARWIDARSDHGRGGFHRLSSGRCIPRSRR